MSRLPGTRQDQACRAYTPMARAVAGEQTLSRAGDTAIIMGQFTFDYLGQVHLERLQHAREELERLIALRRAIDNGRPASLKDYWRSTNREKNILRYEAGLNQWRGESVY